MNTKEVLKSITIGSRFLSASLILLGLVSTVIANFVCNDRILVLYGVVLTLIGWNLSLNRRIIELEGEE